MFLCLNCIRYVIYVYICIYTSPFLLVNPAPIFVCQVAFVRSSGQRLAGTVCEAHAGVTAMESSRNVFRFSGKTTYMSIWDDNR